MADVADPSLHTTRVEIGNDRFQIQTNLTDTEIADIVAFVSKKMEEHVSTEARMDLRKQMILMALDISSELFELRRQVDKGRTYYKESQKTAGVLSDLLEDGIHRANSNVD